MAPAASADCRKPTPEGPTPKCLRQDGKQICHSAKQHGEQIERDGCQMGLWLHTKRMPAPRLFQRYRCRRAIGIDGPTRQTQLVAIATSAEEHHDGQRRRHAARPAGRPNGRRRSIRPRPGRSPCDPKHSAVPRHGVAEIFARHQLRQQGGPRRSAQGLAHRSSKQQQINPQVGTWP